MESQVKCMEKQAQLCTDALNVATSGIPPTKYSVPISALYCACVLSSKILN